MSNVDNNILMIYDDLIQEDYEKMYFVDKIIFGSKFNSSVDNIPENIKTIEFSLFSMFNQSLDNLPNGLNKLVIGPMFNKELDFLPSSLEHLIFQNSFYKHKLDNLPVGLKTLDLGFHYNMPLYNLPPNLETFKIPYWYEYSMKYFPRSIKKMLIPSQFPDSNWKNNFMEIKHIFEGRFECYN